MPRMTFTKDFAKDLTWDTSVHYFDGETYDVPNDLVAEITTGGFAVPEAVTAAPKAADGVG